MVNTIRKNLVALSVRNLVERVTSFFLLILVARYLGKEAYGQYALAVALSSFLVIFADFGINTFVLRDVSQRLGWEAKYLENALILKFSLSAGAILLLFALATALGYAGQVRLIILLVGASFLLKSISELFIAIARAHQRMHYEAVAATLERTIALVGAFLVVTLQAGFLALVLVFFGAVLAQFIYLASVTRSEFVSFHVAVDPGFARKILFQSLPFALFNLLMVANYKLDTVLLSVFHSDSVVGVYNAAYNLIFSLMVFQRVFGDALFPVFSNLAVESRENLVTVYQRSLKFLLATVVPLVLLIEVGAEKIILLLYSSAYRESVVCLRILVVALVFMYASYTLGGVLLALRREAQALVGWLICAVGNLVLNLALIPRYHYVGASVATVLSELLIFAAFYYFLAEKCGYPVLELRFLGKLAVASGALLLVLYQLQSLNLAFLVPVALVFYVMMTMAVGVFSRGELETFARFLRPSWTR